MFFLIAVSSRWMVVHPFWRETAFSAAPVTGKRPEDAHQLRHEPDINTQRSTNYVTQRFIAVDGVACHPPAHQLHVRRAAAAKLSRQTPQLASLHFLRGISRHRG